MTTKMRSCLLFCKPPRCSLLLLGEPPQETLGELPLLLYLSALLAHLSTLYSTAMSSTRGLMLVYQRQSQPQTIPVRILANTHPARPLCTGDAAQADHSPSMMCFGDALIVQAHRQLK